MDAIKFERTQIYFFTDGFTAVVVVLLKVPKVNQTTNERLYTLVMHVF